MGRRYLFTLLFAPLLLAGCQRAQRYQENNTPKISKPAPDAFALPAHYSWMETEPRPDWPIVFVPSTAPAWMGLKNFWNFQPRIAVGTAGLHLVRSPWVSAALLHVTLPADVIQIKVPLGLPDPTPHLPHANPPTLGKWHLGKDLFHRTMLQAGADQFSCAKCHNAQHAFADDFAVHYHARFNTLSLVNSVYLPRLFWDGRAGSLEETLVKSLEDERPVSERKAGDDPWKRHLWGGLVKALSADDNYRQRFREVFGVTQPTQDTIAKALATYIRTLLSGNSMYDLAESARRGRKDDTLAADHVTPFLNSATLKSLERAERKSAEVAREWEKGLHLFQGKGRCAACHRGPLFTDDDFHNVGIRDDRPEEGRFAHVPIGLKEGRLKGAFRTPSLRNLPRTAPYFHDGSRADIRQAIQYFNDGLFYNRHLARVFVADGYRAVSLGLSVEEVDALAVFLRSLDGEALDSVLVGDGKEKR